MNNKKTQKTTSTRTSPKQPSTPQPTKREKRLRKMTIFVSAAIIIGLLGSSLVGVITSVSS